MSAADNGADDKGKLAWAKYHFRDFRNEPTLKFCSLEAVGLWSLILTWLWDCDEPGVLKIRGKAVSDKQLAVLLGRPEDEVVKALRELEDAGTFDRQGGAICSRRMLRDARVSKARSEAGSEGARSRWQAAEVCHGKTDGKPMASAIAESDGKPMARAHARSTRAQARADSDSDSGSSSDSVSGSDPEPRKGSKGKGRKPKEPPEPWETVLARPSYARLRADAEWVSAWGEWIAYCREAGTKGREPQGTQAAAILNEALKVGPAKHAEAIRTAIRGGWQGINAEFVRGGGGKAAAETFDSFLDRAAAKWGVEP